MRLWDTGSHYSLLACKTPIDIGGHLSKPGNLHTEFRTLDEIQTFYIPVGDIGKEHSSGGHQVLQPGEVRHIYQYLGTIGCEEVEPPPVEKVQKVVFRPVKMR